MADIKPLTIWTVYHDDAQIAEYGLKETDTRKLYANHHTDAGHEVNVLNPAWSELTAMFWIWWNTTDTQCIGINHYRRQFEPKRLPLEGEVCIYQMYDWGKETVAEQFARHHGKEALDVMIDCIINHDDKGEWYADNILYGHQLVGNCCFVMTAKDYDRMVVWLFPLLKKIRRRLIGDPESQEDELKRWRDYAVKHFDKEQADYQMRCISFIGERLISAWIMENLTIIETAQ